MSIQDHSPGLRLALRAVSHAELARQLKISKQAVYQWKDIPPRQVLDVERITKIGREKLRPDLYRRRRAS